MRIIQKDATSQSVYLFIKDSSDGSPETGVAYNTAGLVLQYVRQGAAAVGITPAELASASASWASGGIVHVGYGWYRLDIPDAAFADGVDSVQIIGTVTGMVVEGLTVQLSTLEALATSASAQSAAALAQAVVNETAINANTFVETRDLGPTQHTWKLKRSGTGALESTNPIYLKQGDTDVRVAWDCDIPAVLSQGRVLGAQTTPTSTNSDLTLTKLGIEPKKAKVEIDVAADATVGDSWVTCGVSDDLGAGPITIYGKVIIEADPDA